MRLMRYQFFIPMCLGRTSTLQMLCHRHPHLSPHHLMTSIVIVDNFVNLVTGSLPVTDQRLQQISRLQDGDEVCQQLKQYCLNGWHETCKLKGLAKLYQQVSIQIAIQDGLLMRNTGSSSHLFCDKRSRTKSILVTRSSTNAEKEHGSLFICQLEDLIRSCPHCCKEQLQSVEPLIPTEFPSLPCEKVATNLKGKGTTILS